MYNGEYLNIKDFSGGLQTNTPSTSLKPNEFTELHNVILLPGGRGLRSRPGYRTYETQSTTNGQVQLLGFAFNDTNGKDVLLSLHHRTTSNVVVFKASLTANSGYTINDSVSTRFDSYGSGSQIKGDMFQFNNRLLGFVSGVLPFSWDGELASTILSIGGTAPPAGHATAINNRVFCWGVSSSMSTIYWSIIGNESDFAGTGSGSAVVGSLSENQNLVSVIPLSNDTAICFKSASSYIMSTNTAPFPIYTFSKDTGIISAEAWVKVDNMLYFIDQTGTLKVTDGNTIKEVALPPKNIITTPSTNFADTRAYYKSGPDYKWLVFPVVTTTHGTTDYVELVWDLINQCWLTVQSLGYWSYNTGSWVFTKIYDNQIVARTWDRYNNVYLGMSGVVQPLVEGTYYDTGTYEANNVAIQSTVQSGLLGADSFEKFVHPHKLTPQYTTKSLGEVWVYYAFDGNTIDNTGTTTSNKIKLTPVASEAKGSTTINLSGRGHTFQYKLVYNPSPTVATFGSSFELDQITIAGKYSGQGKQK